MGAQNIGRLACSKGGLVLPGLGCAFIIGVYDADAGSLPGATDTQYAKGCLLINIGGNADAQLYVNEGAGLGSAPTWTAIGALE